jgi:hypothetical protein
LRTAPQDEKELKQWLKEKEWLEELGRELMGSKQLIETYKQVSKLKLVSKLSGSSSGNDALKLKVSLVEVSFRRRTRSLVGGYGQESRYALSVTVKISL